MVVVFKKILIFILWIKGEWFFVVFENVVYKDLFVEL